MTERIKRALALERVVSGLSKRTERMYEALATGDLEREINDAAAIEALLEHVLLLVLSGRETVQ